MDAIKICVVLLLTLAVTSGCSDEIPDTMIQESQGTPTSTSTITSTPTSTWNPDGIVSENEYAKSLSLNGGNYVIHWKFAYDTIFLALKPHHRAGLQ